MALPLWMVVFATLASPTRAQDGEEDPARPAIAFAFSIRSRDGEEDPARPAIAFAFSIRSRDGEEDPARPAIAFAFSIRSRDGEEDPARPAIAFAFSIRSRAVQDSRCYLMNGGAVESFFISEDTPVGSIIGTLSVNGDPSALGDIALSLQERDAGLAIAPGSKNLTLARALDREERLGPASLYVNVRCERRRTTDPSFIIPVSVRVWDVNDNAPAWRGAPYSARVSELAAPGTRVLPAPAVDADQPGPHATVHYSVLPGPNSEYIGFANELDSMLVVKKPLDYESVRNFTVRLRAQDQGVPPRYNDTELYIEVLDADDQNPKFTHDHYTAVLPEDAKEGTVLETMPGAISAADQDVGIRAPLQYSLGGAGGAGSAGARPLVTVDRDTGRVAATALLLDVDLPVTVVIKATQVDNPDRYALAALEVSRASARRVRFLRRAFSTRVREDTAPGAMLLALHTAPPQTPLQFYVSDKSFLDKFAINSAGEVLLRKSLDYETTDSYRYQVMVTDGVSNDTASVNITVLNVNEWEPRFRYPHYEFRVDAQAAANTDAVAGEEGDREGGTEGREDLLVGRLDVHDGDRADTVTLTLRGPDAPLLYISETGELFLRRGALAALNASALHVVATAVDSGSPPRQTSVPVTVHVVGAGGGRAARAGVLGGFAAALALLVLLVLALLGYICRARRRSKPGASAVVLPPEKVAGVGNVGGSPALVGGGAVAGGGAATGGGSGSLLSVSAGASTIIAGSTASLERTDPQNGATVGRQGHRFPAKSKVAPAPPVAVPAPALMSDHLGARGTGRSGVAWPSSTIPARVKKLSWDDAQGDAERAEVNEATNSTVAEHMNLTVYF